MSQIGKKITRWLERQAKVKSTVRELSALTDRELSDIGITRSDIYGVAKGYITRATI